jgi:phosphoglycerate dehydrogenase-like enzyme
MEIGIVGLGRMGANLARHAFEKKCRVVAYDHESAARERLAGEGLETAASIKELASKLVPPRIILTYVPHGDPTEDVCRLHLTCRLVMWWGMGATRIGVTPPVARASSPRRESASSTSARVEE